MPAPCYTCSDSKSWRRPGWPIVVAIAWTLVASACGVLSKEPQTTLPVANQLHAMVPDRDSLAGQLDLASFSVNTVIETHAPDTSKVLYQAALDRLGRDLSYTATYLHDQVTQSPPGINSVLISVEHFPDAETARSALAVQQESLTTRTVLSEAESATFKNNVRDISGGWSTLGVQTGADGVDRSWGMAAFADDDFVGYVFVRWGDNSGDQDRLDNIARSFHSRVRSVRHGEFDETPAAELSGADYLVLAAKAMGDVPTYHVDATRDFLSFGQRTSIGLYYNVVDPETAQGTVRLPTQPQVDLLSRGNTSYFWNAAAGNWSCAGIDFNPAEYGLIIPDFARLFEAMQERIGASGPLSKVEVSTMDDGSVRLKTTVDPYQFNQFSPEILGPLSPLREIYPEIGEDGTVEVEADLRKDDLSLTHLLYEMRLPVQGDNLVVRTEMDFSALDAAPDIPSLPVCQDLFQPPCKGDELSGCLLIDQDLAEPAVRRDACDGEGPRICIVPMGGVSQDLLLSAISDLEQLLGLHIALLPAVEVGGNDVGFVDDARDQIDAQILERTLYRRFPEFQQDTDVTLIGITPIDMFSAGEPTSRYSFGHRYSWDSGKQVGVLSYYRMDPLSYGLPENDDLLRERLEKFMLKYILGMRFDVPDGEDPSSVMYNYISSLAALDAIQLAVPDGALDTH